MARGLADWPAGRIARLGSCPVAVTHQCDDPDNDEHQKEYAAELWSTAPPTPCQRWAHDENRNQRDGDDRQRVAVAKETLTGGDFVAVLRNEEPAREVQQDAAAAKDGQHHKGDPDQDRVDPECSRNATRYTADHSGVTGCASEWWTRIRRLAARWRGGRAWRWRVARGRGCVAGVFC